MFFAFHNGDVNLDGLMLFHGTHIMNIKNGSFFLFFINRMQSNSNRMQSNSNRIAIECNRIAIECNRKAIEHLSNQSQKSLENSIDSMIVRLIRSIEKQSNVDCVRLTTPGKEHKICLKTSSKLFFLIISVFIKKNSWI